jgi:hypothetical protein
MCNGNGFMEDEEGVELADKAAAYEKAVAAAREVKGEELRGGELDLTSFIEVEDEAGKLILTLAFDEAVSIRRDHAKDRPRRSARNEGA